MSATDQPGKDEFYESLLGDFLDESAQLLDRLNENLLKLDEWTQVSENLPEPRCHEDLLNDMFRAAHSLKGLSAMLGLQEINHLTHKVENVFDAARKGALRVTREVVNLLFEAVDRLAALIEALKEPNGEPVEYEGVLAKIHQVLKASGADRAQSTQADAERALAAIERGLQALDEPTHSPAEADAALGPVVPVGGQPPSGFAARLKAASPHPPAQGSRIEADFSKQGEQPAGTQAAPSGCLREQPVAATTGGAELSDPLAGIDDEAALPAKYIGIFIDEATETLDQLTELLLANERVGQKETVEQLMVLAHKWKGSAASVGLHRAAKLAHLMEDVLQGLLAQHALPNPWLTDTLLRTTDALRQFVETLRQGQPRTDHFGPVACELLAVQQAIPSQPSILPTPPEARKAEAQAQPSADPVCPLADSGTGNLSSFSCQVPPIVSPDWRQKVVAKLPEGARAIVGEVYFEKELPLVGLKGRLIYEKLCRLGEVCQCDPPPDRLEDAEQLEKFSFALLTEQPLALVENQLEIAGIRGKVLEIWPPQSSLGTPEGSAASLCGPASLAEQLGSAAQSSGSAEAAGASSSRRSAGVPPAGPSAEPPSGEATRPAETLRVDIERLDELMNLAGQLVLNKARFTRIGESLKGLLSARNPLQIFERISAALEAISQSSYREDKEPHKELQALRATVRRIHQEVVELGKELQVLPRARQAVYEFQEAVHQLDRVTDGLQQTVMQTRMVPIGPLFARFKRVVRDITRLNGKSARLVIIGEKTELDKRMIDELGDPLIHLVRNALDHGIEPPEVRESLGKPRQGTVTLEAFHRGNSIVIRVSDDGRGLDAEKILKKAMEKGLVSPADAEKMSRQEIYQLIWQPGLSTAEKVTEISGRGMGMDIVWAKISELNGSVEIDSTPGLGTTMTIKLPLTLAILPSLMIQIDGETFALPIEAVGEIVHLKGSDMYTIQGRWVARVRNTVISVVHLRDLFRWNQPSANQTGKSEQTTLVILGDTGRQIGLAVDGVLGEEDVVIKSISENYHNVPGLAGASILGDGRVALILDVSALVEMASGRHSASSC